MKRIDIKLDTTGIYNTDGALFIDGRDGWPTLVARTNYAHGLTAQHVVAMVRAALDSRVVGSALYIGGQEIADVDVVDGAGLVELISVIHADREFRAIPDLTSLATLELDDADLIEWDGVVELDDSDIEEEILDIADIEIVVAAEPPPVPVKVAEVVSITKPVRRHYSAVEKASWLDRWARAAIGAQRFVSRLRALGEQTPAASSLYRWRRANRESFTLRLVA